MRHTQQLYRKMKDFWKEYWNLCKDSGKFYKKHWKGVILLNTVIMAGELVYFYKDSIKDNLEDLKDKVSKKDAQA